MLVLLIAAAAVVFLLMDQCSVRYTETERGVEYTLSYCGSSGDYCELIEDKSTMQEMSQCDIDLDYVDDSYVGSYSYLKDYLGPTEEEINEQSG